MIKRNAFREKYGKLTDEQLAEYQTIVELGGESEYWKSKLYSMFISFFGVLGFCGYLLAATCPKSSIMVVIALSTMILKSFTKLTVVEEINED